MIKKTSIKIAQCTPVSAVFITKNAAHQLADALKSVQFCQDIVIVDSGSNDNTQTLAQQYKARVFEQAWLGFGPQKQLAIGLAKFDWVLCLDADERVSPALAQAIITALQAPQAMAYEMARSNFFIDRYLQHGEGYPDWSLRLFNRKHANWSNDAVHEKVLFSGKALRLTGDLLHHSAESLEVYLEKQNHYTSLQANTLAGQEKTPSLLKLCASPLLRFIKFYVFKQGFRDGWPGFVHISIGCFNSFIKYAKTRALLNTKNTVGKSKDKGK